MNLYNHYCLMSALRTFDGHFYSPKVAKPLKVRYIQRHCSSPNTHVHIHAQIHMYTQAHMSTQTNKHICKHTRKHTHTYICTSSHTDTHKTTHMYTFLYTHMHTTNKNMTLHKYSRDYLQHTI